jgi:hypothetical protein
MDAFVFYPRPHGVFTPHSVVSSCVAVLVSIVATVVEVDTRSTLSR